MKKLSLGMRFTGAILAVSMCVCPPAFSNISQVHAKDYALYEQLNQTQTQETPLPSAVNGLRQDAKKSSSYTKNEAVILLSDTARKQKLDENKKKLDSVLGKDIDVDRTFQFTDSDLSVAVVSSDEYSTKQLVKKLNAKDTVAIAEPNFVVEASALTNDPYVTNQWYLHDDNNADSDVDFDAKMVSASNEPIVAVLDTGVDASHEDLAYRLTNGTMYDTFTYQTVNATDPNGHGTHVAGTIAASINNGTGISGSSNAKIFPIKCLDKDGKGTSANVLAAYNYLVAQMQAGNKICAINLSLGGFGSGSEILNRVITSAGELGAITVCASGNEGADIDAKKCYPASYDNDYIVTVGASNKNNQIASFSNTGQMDVDVYAPGTDILSTYNDQDYNPEFSHEYSYTDFTNFNTSSVVSNGGSVSLSSDPSYNFEGGNGNSLRWDISTNAHQVYYIAIPYTLSQTIANNAYLGFRLRIVGNSGDVKNAQTKLTFLDAPSGDLKDVLTNETYSNITTPAEIALSPDAWVGPALKIANATYPQTAGTHYAYLCLSAASTANYTFYLDNLGVGKNLQKYAFMQGTSMAAPVVTGEIALLAGNYPNASAKDLRSRIIGGVDCNANYAGHCTSGGKVNFQKALSGNLNPVIQNATINGSSLQLDGTSFGDTPGTITLKNTATNTDTTVSNISWNSTQAVVSLKGLPSATYRVTIKRADGASSLYGKNINYVAPVLVQQVSLNKKKASLTPGKKLHLKATVSPANAADTHVSYTSSNPKYASVSDSGVVTAHKKGIGHTVRITCTATDQGTISATCKVKVYRSVKKLKLNHKKVTVKAGKKVKLKATVKSKKLKKYVVYKTSKKKYATVSKKGVVKTKKAGKGHSVTITCTVKGSNKKVKCKIKMR